MSLPVGIFVMHTVLSEMQIVIDRSFAVQKILTY